MTVRLPTAVAVLSDVMHWIFNGYQAVEGIAGIVRGVIPGIGDRLSAASAIGRYRGCTTQWVDGGFAPVRGTVFSPPVPTAGYRTAVPGYTFER
jgi:hypothetical protein